ncbi:hypothetical protein HDU85_003422 [Gaertneriomyces sp. JEL0708]|nr:hypothetical protein HDU85_003422 [Gaertneriomyces sp. JEL0708]
MPLRWNLNPARAFKWKREYFYHIDSHGYLFLQETKIRNFTSCFKDKPFLNFFFQNLLPNVTQQHPEYEWISPCGPEMNFIKAEDTPIVYHSLTSDNSHLSWAGDLRHPFHPQDIVVGTSGRLYYPSPVRWDVEALLEQRLSWKLRYSLLKSSLVVDKMMARMKDCGDGTLLQWHDGGEYLLKPLSDIH